MCVNLFCSFISTKSTNKESFVKSCPGVLCNDVLLCPAQSLTFESASDHKAGYGEKSVMWRKGNHFQNHAAWCEDLWKVCIWLKCKYTPEINHRRWCPCHHHHPHPSHHHHHYPHHHRHHHHCPHHHCHHHHRHHHHRPTVEASSEGDTGRVGRDTVIGIEVVEVELTWKCGEN